jgi:hypothetical protein
LRLGDSSAQIALHRFFQQAVIAINLTQPLPVAMAAYSVLRAGVRLFGYQLPGQCTNSVLNLSFSSGTCIPATNWLDTRISWATSAHAWSWILYGGFALAVALWHRPSGSFNGWLALMLTGFAIAGHELFWFGTYFVVHPNAYDVWMNLQVYGSFIAFAAIGIVAFYLLDFQRYFDLRWLAGGLAVCASYYVGWAAIGYPLTLDLKTGMAPPALFGVLWVDAIEFYSWVLFFAAVGLAYYAKQSHARLSDDVSALPLDFDRLVGDTRQAPSQGRPDAGDGRCGGLVEQPGAGRLHGGAARGELHIGMDSLRLRMEGAGGGGDWADELEWAYSDIRPFAVDASVCRCADIPQDGMVHE